MSEAWALWAQEASDPARAPDKPQALDDLLVLDCSYGSLAGCVCSSILAEFGAEVVRIEPPDGDLARHFTPWASSTRGRVSATSRKEGTNFT